MTSSPVNQIKKMRAQKGLSQAQLAEAVGAHWITISKLERGKIRLTQEWMNRIAKVLGVDPVNLIDASSVISEITMYGILNEISGKVKLSENDAQWTSTQKIKVELGNLQGDRDIWVTVATNRFYPFIHPGDLIRFTYISDFKLVESVINRLCLIHVQKKEDVLIGFLRWIGKEKVFDLDVPGSTPIRGVQAEEIAGATLIVGDPQLALRHPKNQSDI